MMGCLDGIDSGAELYTSLATGVVEGAHWADAGPMYEMNFMKSSKTT